MAEPNADASKAPNGQDQCVPPAPDNVLPLTSGEPSDDAPTVISNTQIRPARPEDAFGNTLRGRRLAHFELLEPIGVGGMAAVIRARDTQLDRTVALKILPPEMAVDPENVRRFHQEARAAAKLDHENIARVFFCGEDQGLNFIAFEFVEGDNLGTLLDRRGHLPVPEAVHYMLQIATGLAHSSDRGVVHRDIKPSNIIVSPNGRSKLVDMGLARSLEPHGDHGLTQSGVTLGTFDYISPEQALEPREADVRSDIYSLGCTFYHVLTGRAPVPEGTAAKKLHHHQQVAPIDPRQINPAIPDDVAAILARMMAKDPTDRYQGADHLVQHLLQLAQRLGPLTDVPEGVLYVDTPLPSPPQVRPILVASAAALVLVLLVVLHGMVPWTAPGPNSAAANPKAGEVLPFAANSASPAANNPPDIKKPQLPKAAPPVFKQFLAVRTAGDLADALKGDWQEARVLLANDLNLTQENLAANSDQIPGLFFDGRGKKLTIQAQEGLAHRPIIRLTYDANLPPDGPDDVPVWTALTVRGGSVTLSGLRFEVDATQAPRIVMAAIKLEDEGKLVLDNCEFIQSNPPSTEQGQLSSILVEGAPSRAQKPSLTITRCYFASGEKKETPAGAASQGGQDAVTASGPAFITATECAFGPYVALFHCRKSSKTHGPEIWLNKCSALLVDGCVFQVEEGVACRLDAKNSLFSRPDSVAILPNAPTVLIQQNGEGVIHYTGQDNRYHNLGAFWLKTSGMETTTQAYTLDEFRKVLKDGRDEDKGSIQLTANPWRADDPLALLQKNRPRLAFQVDERQQDLRQVSSPRYLVGVDHCAWGPTYDHELQPLDSKPPETVAGKIVDPMVAQTGNNIYNTLSGAIAEAKPGETIQIRHTGLLPVDPVRLEKPDINLTIKPYRDYHPVLTLDRTTQDDAPLFRLHDGVKLTLQGLEFLLRPERAQIRSQAVVALVGDAECNFQDCIATLEKLEGVSLALVTLADSRGVMKMEPLPPRQQSPTVRLERCFVRGEGDLMMVRASRPLVLDVRQTLAALNGSFLNVEGLPREAQPAAQPTSPADIRLANVTTYLADHLVRLRAKEASGLVPVHIRTAENCLFVSKEGKALVHLDDMETNESQMRTLFVWVGSHNAYNRFVQMLDQKPPGDDMPVPPYFKEKWMTFTGEQDGRFNEVRFAETPVPDLAWSKLLPKQFKLVESERKYGADIETLPGPAAETNVSLAPAER